MADEEKKKTEEETTEDAEHKFDPDSDACGACGGCGGGEEGLIFQATIKRACPPKPRNRAGLMRDKLRVGGIS